MKNCDIIVDEDIVVRDFSRMEAVVAIVMGIVLQVLFCAITGINIWNVRPVVIMIFWILITGGVMTFIEKYFN